jgi:hypothetical protein
MPCNYVPMIHFPVFGMTYVPEQRNLVEAGDRHSLIAECRVQHRSSADEFDLQTHSGEATANS